MSDRQTNPADNAEVVDISSTDATLSRQSRGIYVGVSGDLKVKLLGGQTVTFVGLAAGVIHPIRVKQVIKVGTTATSILSVY